MKRYSAIFVSIVALATLIVVGVVGYMWIAGMTFIDALYMTVITLTTVGYLEVQPLDTLGRIFTMLLLTSGLGIFLYCIGIIAREVLEGELQRTFGRRRVQRQIDQLSNHFIVCGCGRMGRIVCNELAARPVPFVVIERSPETLQTLDGVSFLSVLGDATEDAVLEQAGIARARGLITVLSSDSDNVYVVLSARELNPKLEIVARAEDTRSERKLLHAGATRVVSPYVIGGHRMANVLLRPGVLDVIDLVTDYRSLELQIEEIPLVASGTPVEDPGLYDRLRILVIALKRANGEMVFKPSGSDHGAPGDRLIVMGEGSALRELEKHIRRA